MKGIARYFVSVKEELKKVRWPKKKEMVTYSTATVLLLLFFMLFFVACDVLISFAVKVFS